MRISAAAIAAPGGGGDSEDFRDVRDPREVMFGWSGMGDWALPASLWRA